MESAVVLRSFQGSLQPTPYAHSFLRKPAAVHICRAASKKSSFWRLHVEGWRNFSTMAKKRPSLLSVKASETTSAMTADAMSLDAADESLQGAIQKINAQNSTFPNGFETFVLEVCDQTNVAELKLKVGDFEMHLKRGIETPKVPTSIAPPIESPTTAPPIPSKPMVESAPAPPPAVSQKSDPTAISPFTNVSTAAKSKLAALEASGSNAYVLVSSPTVGSFRSGRTLKGKKQPPSCKEGDIIKDGQIIGFLDQFGNELPVRSDVEGEVLKVLLKDGEVVGYGDPLVAVLPSFHGIK
ncbi:uncharacterized protein LOC103715096 isoform X1 [Phoenix dactylifera]|uniref:Uncharacterized protein LOC103715096 isoform X1 n=1 Tax=Phoenix dactylifera TaxID=42345 RepID=A0A8B7CKD5_PHODC|nr:uncharacterized protein LOC103715096 isoform X1 [Phoenix dactylifera]